MINLKNEEWDVGFMEEFDGKTTKDKDGVEHRFELIRKSSDFIEISKKYPRLKNGDTTESILKYGEYIFKVFKKERLVALASVNFEFEEGTYGLEISNIGDWVFNVDGSISKDTYTDESAGWEFEDELEEHYWSLFYDFATLKNCWDEPKNIRAYRGVYEVVPVFDFHTFYNVVYSGLYDRDEAKRIFYHCHEDEGYLFLVKQRGEVVGFVEVEHLGAIVGIVINDGLGGDVAIDNFMKEVVKSEVEYCVER